MRAAFAEADVASGRQAAQVASGRIGSTVAWLRRPPAFGGRTTGRLRIRQVSTAGRALHANGEESTPSVDAKPGIEEHRGPDGKRGTDPDQIEDGGIPLAAYRCQVGPTAAVAGVGVPLRHGIGSAVPFEQVGAAAGGSASVQAAQAMLCSPNRTSPVMAGSATPFTMRCSSRDFSDNEIRILEDFGRAFDRLRPRTGATGNGHPAPVRGSRQRPTGGGDRLREDVDEVPAARGAGARPGRPRRRRPRRVGTPANAARSRSRPAGLGARRKALGP